MAVVCTVDACADGQEQVWYGGNWWKSVINMLADAVLAGRV